MKKSGTMEIGSFFEFETSLTIKKSKLFESLEYLSTGRSIIKYYDHTMRKGVFLVPDFICSSVVDSITNNKIIFFNINRDFSINFLDLKNKILNYSPLVIIIVHYFGSYDKNFNKIKKLIKQKNIILLEDFSQAFFSNQNYFIKKELNIVKFNNVRKFFGIPELSFISSLDTINIDKKIVFYKELILCGYYFLFLLKKLFHFFLINQPFFFKKCYDNLEEKVNNLPYFSKSNKISIFIFKHIDFKKIKNKRLKNYNILENGIKNNKIKFIEYINTNKDEVPFYAIIQCEKAKNLKKYLIKHNVYSPNLWPIPKNRMTTEIKFIKSNYLFIPIDHRYNKKDINRINKILNNWEQ